MGADAPQRMYDVYSKRDAQTGQSYLNDASLLLGDGSTIVFTNGVAENVPESAVAMVRHRSDLIFEVRKDSPVADDAPTPAAAAPEPEPAEPPQPDPDPQDQQPNPTEVPPDVIAAQEHLRAEGLEVPDPDVAKAAPIDAPNEPLIQLRPGFESTTADGARRCLAAKGDGTQCKNEAIQNTWACGMQPHQDQIAELQEAMPAPAAS